MCGIAGIFDRQGGYPIGKQVLMDMARALVHRGPDDEGYFITDRVGFGFRRLAIIDLAGGQQPIYNEDGTIVLVCNGEIFNYKELRNELVAGGHRFRTDCDVEVLVHLYEAYGVDFLSRLNGQYAFAIYDQVRERLLIARDHVGIAPLYYSLTRGLLVFASEVKAILQHPAVTRKVNLQGLDQVLTFPGNVSPTTMFEGIHSLRPGHYLLVDAGGVEERQYWDLSYPEEAREHTDKPESYYVERLNELLLRAVQYRLQADVPVGFYLSGGLDSSLIGAMVKTMPMQHGRKSFSIAFRQPEIDESSYQERVASLLGTQHHRFCFDWEDIADGLRSAVYHSEAPLKETYNTCSLALSRVVRQNKIKVVLSGEGADELFAGYVGYKFDSQERLGAQDLTACERAYEEELRDKLWGDPDFFYDKNYRAFGQVKAALYSAGVHGVFEQIDSTGGALLDKTKLRGRSRLHKRSYLDFKLRLSDHLVADHGDRMAYANSIEARYPFLDVNVIEFVQSIPSRLKLNGLTEKYILKQLAGRYLPREITTREKFSFVAPGSPYLIGKSIPWINDLLSYETIKRQGYFNPDVVERLKKKYLTGNFSVNQTFETDLLMIILTFSIFLELFGLPDLT